MADILSTTAHRNPLWVSAYDDYPMQSIREKERLTRYYVAHQYWFLFYHDVQHFAAKLSKDLKVSKRQFYVSMLIKKKVNQHTTINVTMLVHL